MIKLPNDSRAYYEQNDEHTNMEHQEMWPKNQFYNDQNSYSNETYPSTFQSEELYEETNELSGAQIEDFMI